MRALPTRPTPPAPERRSRARGGYLARSALCFAGLVLIAAGCRTTPKAGETDETTDLDARVRASDVGPQFASSLAALEAALLHQDDAEARSILDRLMLRRPRGAALELAKSFERVLRGRECLSAVRLFLEIDEDTRSAENLAFDVTLRGTSSIPLVLRPGPGTLRVTTVAVSTRGLEERRVESRACGILGDLVLAPDRDVSIGLWQGAIELPRGALAVRRTFELELRAGLLYTADVELPAQRPEVKSAEASLIAESSLAALDADGFTALVRRTSTDSQALLRAAVMLPADERERALDLLWPLASEIPRASVEALVPALRWLSGSASPGGDPDAWRAWLAARSDRRAREKPRPALALPTPGPDS